MNDSDSLSFTNGTQDLPFSTSIWLYQTAQGNNWILSKRGNSTNVEWQAAAISGKIYLELFSGGGNTIYIGKYTSAIPLSTWTYVSTTYDGSGTANGIKIYINGVSVASTTEGSGSYISMLNGTSHLFIAKDSWGNNLYYKGSIDEPRISSTARSADWIKTEYNNQSAPTTFETSASEESVTAPGAPTLLTLTPNNGQVALSWTAPGNTGGLALSDYVIDYKPTLSSIWSTYADGVSTSTTFTIIGLTNGTSYDFRVSAVNAVGQGSASATATAVPATTPDAPLGVSATAGNAQATISFTAPSGAAKWYNGSWGYREKITIDHTKVGNTTGTLLSYFPVLVSTTSVALEYTGFTGGHVGLSTGKDVLFTLSDGTTKLNHEIESYASSTGNLISWIKVPSISTSTDTVLYMYYGNAAATDQSTTTGVWDDGGSNYFKGVWHAKEATGVNWADSTSNNNTGTPTSVTATSSGQIDGAGSFNGTSSYVNLPNFAYNTTATYSAWVYVLSSTLKSGIFGNDVNASGGWSYNFCGGFFEFGSNIYGSLYSNSTYQKISTPIILNSWMHIVFIKDMLNSVISLYANGSLINTIAFTPSSLGILSGTTNHCNNNYLKIGYYSGNNTSTPYQYYSGTIDEVELSSTARSADWIKTEYNNQNSPNTFYSVASEEASSTTSSNGGSAITSYTVTSSPGAIASSSTASPIIVTGLTNGTPYTFTVTATNAIGTSSASVATSPPVTPATVPDAPTGLTATSGNASVALSWTAPGNGGLNISNYVVDFKLTSTTTWSQFGSATSTATTTTVTGLTNGQQYNFEVYAVNAIGTSLNPSNVATATPATTPTATTSPATAVSTSTMTLNGSITDTGGSNATQSGFAYGTAPDLSTVIATTTLGPWTGTTTFSGGITGLAPNTLYYFRAYAVNSAGTSTGLILSTTTLQWTLPDAPTIGVATAGNATATVSFTPPLNNGGSTITRIPSLQVPVELQAPVALHQSP